MRNFCAALVAVSLIIVPMASAQTLSPGKPAGVRPAQQMDNTPWIFVGIGAVAAGIAIAASNSGGDSSPGTTTTLAPPTTG